MNKIKNIFLSITIIFIFSIIYYLIYHLAEPKAYDFMVKNVLIEKMPFDHIKKNYGSDNIVLVVIDEKTVEKYRWPWKRDFDCKAFEFFSKYTKAKLVVDDRIFVNLDTSYPQADKIFFMRSVHTYYGVLFSTKIFGYAFRLKSTHGYTVIF